ncbi:MAG: family 16 glycoside hydrolase [Dysgonomonas sp.]|nr:family 16 glycoside hydrolase [Dysgonomonas sp.]
MKILFINLILSILFLFNIDSSLYGAEASSPKKNIKQYDISADTARQVIIAQGTEDIYQGHPTTVLLPDGKTIYCVWTYKHAGPCGPLKKSIDGGLTWSELLDVPENWTTVRNCPTIYRLPDPKGNYRLFVFAGEGPGKKMYQSCSEDLGQTWSSMKSNDLGLGAMPFCTIEPINGGKELLAMSNIRRPGEKKEKRSNVVARSYSKDGGFTWSPWDITLDIPGLKPCEPEIVRSPDGKQLLCLIRENVKRVSLYMVSNDEGRTWSKVKPLPFALHGDRHKAKYTPDGRLVIAFRDTGNGSITRTHFVAWVGRYEDIINGKQGDFRIKLLHSYRGGDCGYPGLELLPDGTFVATTYIKYRSGVEKNSVVSTRFKLEEFTSEITENNEWISLFDGKTLNGWRGYNRNDIPKKWTVENGAIKINSSPDGRGGSKDGGDIIFDKKFKNFELEFEYKISKGANSGVFYLATESKGKRIFQSAPEYQILDNENHKDARLGKDGNRKSASLYDMIPAKPQNAKSFGKWNKGRIIVRGGNISHYQNGKNVLGYQLWTPKWDEMVAGSKFNQWPEFLNPGGIEHSGYIGLQDHGNDVWFKNIRIRELY